MTTTGSAHPTGARRRITWRKSRVVCVAVILAVLFGIAIGTKVVANNDPLVKGAVKFDPATFAAENFPIVQSAISDKAVDASSLATAIAADPTTAASKFGVASSGGPVYSVSFSGLVGDGKSGIYSVSVPGLPADLTVRVQTGPAINGTELRDATGAITFGQFTNQIDFQNAAAALNDMVKTQVLAPINTSVLTGKNIAVIGAFTLVNPKSWLVTPVKLTVQ